jgi:hypothetical protein
MVSSFSVQGPSSHHGSNHAVLPTLWRNCELREGLGVPELLHPMSWKAHGSVLMVNRCMSQGTCPGERVEGAMRPPLDLTSRHQMAKLSLNKWENFDSVEMFKVKLNVQQGFHHGTSVSPKMQYLLQQVIRRYHKAQGRYGGTGTVPSVFLSVLYISCQIKGILQSQNFRNCRIGKRAR